MILDHKVVVGNALVALLREHIDLGPRPPGLKPRADHCGKGKEAGQADQDGEHAKGVRPVPAAAGIDAVGHGLEPYPTQPRRCPDASRRTGADEIGDRSVPTDQEVRRAPCVPVGKADRSHGRAATVVTERPTSSAGPSTSAHDSPNVASKLVM